MIDLHCHLLPGIDDGALDVEDSLAMARTAASDGIDRICATPHVRHDHDVRVHELPDRVAELNARLRSEAIAVEALPGGEVAETALGGLDDAELRQASLGAAGGWVLLEPAPGPLSGSLERAVEALADRGYRALIAHPERHLGADLVERLETLVNRGALVQVTAATVLDEASAQAMLGLAGRGLVHVVGSDAHSSRFGRPVRIAAAIERLGEVEPARSNIDWIAHTAPEAIVRGEPLERPY